MAGAFATDPKWRPNPGQRPREAKGKRVRVLLLHGRAVTYDDNPMSPPGWAADTCRWGLDLQYSFSITHYAVIGD
jgi:hypothetical protein